MAADWIKMRTDLYRDPKVCVIADLLISPDGDLARYVDQHCQRHMTITRNVMRNVTVGALVTVWGVTRLRGKRNGDDLVLRHATLSVIDDMADLPGFGEAMASVEWAIETAEGVVFPNFFESYNVDPEGPAASKAAERQRRYRERLKGESDVTRDVTRDASDDVTVTSRNASREEKRREEKKEETHMSGKPDPASEIIDYLNEKSGRSFKNVKANTDLVMARIKEGATVDEIKAVIDGKVRAWGNDPKMAEYLRPETLFGARKFAQYAGQMNGHREYSRDRDENGIRFDN